MTYIKQMVPLLILFMGIMGAIIPDNYLELNSNNHIEYPKSSYKNKRGYQLHTVKQMKKITTTLLWRRVRLFMRGLLVVFLSIHGVMSIILNRHTLAKLFENKKERKKVWLHIGGTILMALLLWSLIVNLMVYFPVPTH